jgi:hypothetical protein
MTIMSQYDEEKKDDEILYWEPSFNGFEKLPSLKIRPKMIVFDKDGTYARIIICIVTKRFIE